MMLDFVVQPAAPITRRIGNKRSGIIEVQEYGGLTTEEDDCIAELLSEEDSAFVEAAIAADAIAKAEDGLSIVEAFAIIKQAMEGKELEDRAEGIRLRHAGLFQRIARVFSRSGQRSMEASVTAIIRYRQNRMGWTLADTRKLPRVILNGLNQLVQDEQAAERIDAEPAGEEELGKPSAVSGNPPEPTGAESSGSCVEPTQDSFLDIPSDESAVASS